jgi:hypothetical protein
MGDQGVGRLRTVPVAKRPEQRIACKYQHIGTRRERKHWSSRPGPDVLKGDVALG